MPVNKRKQPQLTEKDLSRLRKKINENNYHHQEKAKKLKEKFIQKNQ
jgi:hypothetical protein